MLVFKFSAISSALLVSFPECVRDGHKFNMAESLLRAGFSKGEHTLFVSNNLFADNRRRLCQRLTENASVPENAFILLQGGESLSLYDTDVEYVFRQEPYFHWMFGVKEPDFYGVVEVSTAKTMLFMPRLPEDFAIWIGRLLSKDEFKKMYSVDEVHYVDDIATVLKKCNPSVLLTLTGMNTDSGLTVREAAFDGINEFTVDNKLLHPEIAECRVIKSDLELEVLRYVNKISSDAHIHVMRTIRSGMMEYQAEATFLNYIYVVGGCRYHSYTCICSSGENGSLLHYGHANSPNDKHINDGDMCLFDMGGSYCGYSSDITCSFPANGKFTKDQVIIYNAVLNANKAVMNAAKPGVSWVDMHKLANRVLLTDLRDAGLLQGDVGEMMEAGLAAIFQPHGLGHFMGLDVHDVGGYLEGTPSRPTEPGLNKLRTARVLEKGMVITIEPGCYFSDVLLDKALANPKQAKFLVRQVIERFRNFGGVRIEDDVIIMEDGVENMTKVPRTIEEIEAVMENKIDLVPAAPSGKTSA
ncbi:xaa-Pro dipeptidase isoform X3 [Zootermopsis nevadensis]|uniref:xaa-Pro dipeptidase isoform X3 n=1 Tax=Zootermopsis nevadensis TaxID=136037 RepID=UPI000B8E3AF0|nr:xaa-Pro dipeptidase isoform X3 [Zootermopsis nevadensis]